MDNPVIILGAGKTGEVALDILTSNGLIIYCFLDENEKLHGTEIDEITVLGDVFDDGHLKMIGKKCNAFIAVDDLALKKSLVKNLNERRKMMPINAVHTKAIVSRKATLGHGNLIEQGVSIGTKADIANHSVIRANASIANHTKIGNYVQIGAGSVIGSDVTIEDEVFIGSGVTIVSGITINKGARIGAGSVVIANVNTKETVFGNPAQKVS